MEDLLGKMQVIKATLVQTGDFLVGDNSTAEVISVQIEPGVVLVDLAVKGLVRLDPDWDVAVFRKN